MIDIVRRFLAAEAAVFGAAALIHSGVLLRGYEHWKAATAETVIGLALAVGLAATAVAPSSSRTIGLAAQAFALFGTLVGVFTIVMGIGPRSALDVSLHGGMITLLGVGLIVVARRGAGLTSHG